MLFKRIITNILTILLYIIDKVGDVVLLFAKKKPPKDTYLIEEIHKTKLAMEAAYSNFQNVVDPDLIDSCIYELNAVQNKYKFLLKQAKATNTNFG
jgi:Protein of unknown function (DUF2508).